MGQGEPPSQETQRVLKRGPIGRTPPHGRCLVKSVHPRLTPKRQSFPACTRRSDAPAPPWRSPRSGRFGRPTGRCRATARATGVRPRQRRVVGARCAPPPRPLASTRSSRRQCRPEHARCSTAQAGQLRCRRQPTWGSTSSSGLATLAIVSARRRSETRVT